jgi:anti-sigma regulatory factor (Ser/Thr protein kinase)
VGSSASVARDHAHTHVVGVYDRDDELISTVATFLIDALRQGGTAIVIATPAHRAALDAELTAEGFPVRALRGTNRYRVFDAEEMLATLLRGHRPDPAAFESAIGSIIETATSQGRPVVCFGEMVGLLWEQGNLKGALELESLWNDLAEHHDFALFCGYAMSTLEASDDASANRRMYDEHSEVFFERLFDGVPTAPRDVRRFVREVLLAWGDDQQLGDAELIASELATNAVKHAHSPFRVSVARTASTTMLAVRDTSFEQPEPRARPTHDGGGRGLALVSELSSSWGTRPEADGKTVWAEVTR